MKLNWKVLRLAILLSGVILASGCGGFSGSHSVSPLSLLLPGLVQQTPAEKQKQQKATPVAAVAPVSPAELN